MDKSVTHLYLVLHLSAAAQKREETPSHQAHSPGKHFFQWPGLNGPQSPQEKLLWPCIQTMRRTTYCVTKNEHNHVELLLISRCSHCIWMQQWIGTIINLKDFQITQ